MQSNGDEGPWPELLTSAEACKWLRISEKTLRGIRQRGLIRYVAITDRKILYRLDDLRAFASTRSRHDGHIITRNRNDKGIASGAKIMGFTERRRLRKTLQKE